MDQQEAEGKHYFYEGNNGNAPRKQNVRFPLCTTSEVSNQVAEHVPDVYVPFMQEHSFAFLN